MSKRIWSIVLMGALVASVFSVIPAQAGPIPDVVQIDDPACDANPTGAPTAAGCDGNVSNVGDLQKIWFTNDAENISVHIQTTAAPPAGAIGIFYEIEASPGEGPVSKQETGCLFIRAVFPAGNAGGTYQGGRLAKLLDRCNEGTHFFDNGVEGQIEVEKLDDGTGLTHLTFPRSYSPLLADGQTIVAPKAQDYGAYGTDKASLPATPVRGAGPPLVGIVRYDVTDRGTDYSITAGGNEPPPATDPPGKNDPPGKKKGCKKGSSKAEKKGCKKKGKKNQGPKTPPGRSCASYAPGEKGKEAETIVLSDEATAEKPVVHEVELGQYFFEGATGTPPSKTLNVQVDSAATTTGLYATFKFPSRRDYDLFAYWPSDKEAASSHGFNPLVEARTPPPLPDPSNTRNNHAGETKADSENIVGLITPDCGGYTLEMLNYFGEGGKLELSLWLGEGTAEPKPES